MAQITRAEPELRVVWLNAISPSMFAGEEWALHFSRFDAKELKEFIENLLAEGATIVSYIRHPATVKVLREHFGDLMPETPDSGVYTYRSGDILVIVTLRKPQRGAEVQQVKIEDLDFVVAEWMAP